ncbi:curlin [Sphingobium sp. LB126]|uniref:CsgG/HfaB family protein n=1 Tax=Sphingobium sp. LB126 TaxID=1983755 RepID=UPI000CB21347|nr:CsgG/HfaB family protein [Sphingobium sp. LB126]PJG47318.1 curlin [Sphingobium sp. LB126]
MRLSSLRSCLPMLAAAAVLSGCATANPVSWQQPVMAKPSQIQNRLALLPASGKKVAVAVYGFTDQTGQFKPTDNVQTLSRAVTQGATSILVKALQDAGNRQFFQVIERERLDNVLRERAVIREMRASYLGEKQVNPQALPPLLFAGLLLEGGIIGYDSNIKTGGAGARFLGIGGSSQYREDTVTLYLRAVSVKTGEVLTSVNVRKSIASVALGANAFRYVGFKDLLELEAGVTFNEPDQLAVQQAVEKAVYALIAEGALQDLWCFGTTEDYSANLLRDYVAERDSIKAQDVILPQRADGSKVTGACQVASRHAATAPPRIQTQIVSGPAVGDPALQTKIVQARPAGK